MVDATISRVRLRDLTRLGRSRTGERPARGPPPGASASRRRVVTEALRASATPRRRAPERPARAPNLRSHGITHLAERELVAGHEPAAGRFTRRELEDGVRAAPGSGAPGAKIVRDPEYTQSSVQEDRIDREAHEKGVDGRGRAKEQSLARPQLIASEQSPHARDR